MKRILSFLISAVCVFSFASCKKDDSSSAKDNTNGKNSSVTDSTEDSSASQEEKKEFDAQAILDEIIANHEFSDMTELEDTMFLEVMYSVQAADVKQFAMYINETGISADEIIIIEAVDADAKARVLELISNWYVAKGVQMKDYIPEEYEKIEKCSVKSSGNIVYMVVADNNTEIEKIIEKYI